MYERFYGLTDKPFHIVPNPEYLYLSRKHEHALAYLEYGLSEDIGFVLLTGDIGTGKTTLIRHLLNQVDKTLEVAVIFNTNVSADELLCLILQEFEIAPVPGEKAGNIEKLYQYLIARFSEGKRVLLIVDEAQNLPVEAMEEVRMLSNLQSDSKILVQVMLVGQPELRRRIQQPELAQLAQRIAANYHLTGLSREEMGEYVKHRIKKAGGKKEIFKEEALDLVFETTGGIPRAVNVICDAALVYGFADELKFIETDVIRQVIENRTGIGMGISREDSDQDSDQDSHGFNDLGKQIKELEGEIAELKLRVNWQTEELSRREDALKEELIGNLKSLLQQERKRNDRLLSMNSRLLVQNKTLLRQKTISLESNTEPEDDNTARAFSIFD